MIYQKIVFAREYTIEEIEIALKKLTGNSPEMSDGRKSNFPIKVDKYLQLHLQT